MASIMQNQARLVSLMIMDQPVSYQVVQIGNHTYLNVLTEDLGASYGAARTSENPYRFSLSAPLPQEAIAPLLAKLGQSEIPKFAGWGDLATHCQAPVKRLSEIVGGAPLAPTLPPPSDASASEVAKLKSELASVKAKLAKTRQDARAMHADLSGEIKRLMGEGSASPLPSPKGAPSAPPQGDQALRVWATGWLAARRAKQAKSWRPLMNEAIEVGIASPDTTPKALDALAASTLA